MKCSGLPCQEMAQALMAAAHSLGYPRRAGREKNVGRVVRQGIGQCGWVSGAHRLMGIYREHIVPPMLPHPCGISRATSNQRPGLFDKQSLAAFRQIRVHGQQDAAAGKRCENGRRQPKALLAGDGDNLTRGQQAGQGMSGCSEFRITPGSVALRNRRRIRRALRPTTHQAPKRWMR